MKETQRRKKCDYIRYPYMKIKDYRKRSVLDYSAVCVIENNDLNSFLREIENPEHNRLADRAFKL